MEIFEYIEKNDLESFKKEVNNSGYPYLSSSFVEEILYEIILHDNLDFYLFFTMFLKQNNTFDLSFREEHLDKNLELKKQVLKYLGENKICILSLCIFYKAENILELLFTKGEEGLVLHNKSNFIIFSILNNYYMFDYIVGLKELDFSGDSHKKLKLFLNNETKYDEIFKSRLKSIFNHVYQYNLNLDWLKKNVKEESHKYVKKFFNFEQYSFLELDEIFNSLKSNNDLEGIKNLIKENKNFSDSRNDLEIATAVQEKNLPLLKILCSYSTLNKASYNQMALKISIEKNLPEFTKYLLQFNEINLNFDLNKSFDILFSENRNKNIMPLIKFIFNQKSFDKKQYEDLLVNSLVYEQYEIFKYLYKNYFKTINEKHYQLILSSLCVLNKTEDFLNIYNKDLEIKNTHKREIIRNSIYNKNIEIFKLILTPDLIIKDGKHFLENVISLGFEEGFLYFKESPFINFYNEQTLKLIISKKQTHLFDIIKNDNAFCFVMNNNLPFFLAFKNNNKHIMSELINKEEVFLTIKESMKSYIGKKNMSQYYLSEEEYDSFIRFMKIYDF